MRCLRHHSMWCDRHRRARRAKHQPMQMHVQERGLGSHHVNEQEAQGNAGGHIHRVTAGLQAGGIVAQGGGDSRPTTAMERAPRLELARQHDTKQCLEMQRELGEEHLQGEEAQQARPEARVPRQLARVYRERVMLEGLTDEEVYGRYRLTRASLVDLYEVLNDDLDPRATTNRAVPGLAKMLSAIHFLASGSFQSSEGIVSGMSQSTFSRVLGQFLTAMTNKAQRFISFPDTREGLRKVRSDFYRKGDMPNVIGAIDCMHVAIRPPAHQEAQFRNRKHFHSLNVQVACDSHMRIQSVVAGFPGSTSDASVLRQSALYQLFESGELGGGWLLGDTGYGCRSWLLTPISNPQSPAEDRFNQAHRRTWSAVERAIGLLKVRFRCLDRSSGALQYSPDRVCDIITACCVLHNIAVQANCLGDRDIPLVEEEEDEAEPVHTEATAKGAQIRNRVIRGYFT